MTLILQENIRRGYFKKALGLLKEDKSLAKETNPAGRVPLHVAFRFDCIPDPYLIELLSLLIKIFPDGAKAQDGHNNLSIHYAVFSGYPKGTIQLLIDLYPEGVKFQNGKGDLPLHLALERKKQGTWNGQNCIVNLLMEKFAEGIEAKNAFGKLPIHVGANSGAAYAVIKDLVRKYPRGLEMQDNDGRLPLHLIFEYQGGDDKHDTLKLLMGLDKHDTTKLLKGLVGNEEQVPTGLQVKDIFERLPIHYAAMGWCSDADLILLIKRYPTGVTHPDGNGKLAIHYAVGRCHGPVWRLNTFAYLVRKYPSCLEHQDKEGKLPIHVDAARTWCGHGSIELAQYLLSLNPSSAWKHDNDGNLPIHLASKTGKEELCALLISQYPEGLMCKNKRGCLPIDYCGKQKDDLFLLLAKSCPQSLCICNSDKLVQYLSFHNLSKKRSRFVQEVLEAAFSQSTAKKERLLQPQREEKRPKSFMEEQAKLKKCLSEMKKQHEASLAEEKERHNSDKEELRKAHPEVEETGRGHAEDVNKLQESHEKELERVRHSRYVFLMLAAEGRKSDELCLAKLQNAENELIMEEKSFATSLKKRIDLIKADRFPHAKLSHLHVMFPAFIKDPNLSRSALVHVIDSLNTELSCLHAALEAATTEVGNAVADECSDISTTPATNNREDRQPKRRKVSLA